MRAAALPSPTNPMSLVARATATMKEIVRACRSRATRHQQWEYARTVAKANLSSDKAHAFEHVMALVVDLGHRSDHPENAEAPGLYLAAVGRSAWADAHPNHHAPQLSRDEARIAEQIAQGEAENAEKAYDIDPSVGNAHRLLAASGKYVAAVKARDEAVRRDLAKRST